MIDFYTEDIDFQLENQQEVRAWIVKVIRHFKKEEGDLSYIFCSDKYQLEINKSYLNHHYFTDIITFNYNEGNTIAGDIFISIDTVRANADEYKVTFEMELKRVMIHGILHLIGFNDKTDDQQEEMTRKEDEALNMF